jgi:serine/threonine-protein kinase
VHEHVTLLRPDTRRPESGGISRALPPDLLEQVRSRVGLLAMLLLIAFAVDPIIYFGIWASARVTGRALPVDFSAGLPFQYVSFGAVVASAGLWWVARNRTVSPSLLHTIGLAYEIVICFIIGVVTCWPYYLYHGVLPNLTWVPAVVILFPLIMPGPPLRMLAAAVAAAAMSPLAILVLDLAGKVTANTDSYVSATLGATLAVVFAYMGARVVYGLGRDVAHARELGSYRLEEPLGSGGMGEVWRARHRMLARPAAIKLIRPSLLRDGHPGALARFEREAQAIARLRSPHTVTLFDFGAADDGSFYYVMELLDGLDADKLVRRFGPLPAERAISLLRQVCHSLSEADSYGLVHRDIKPANLFLCRYGEDCDFVKVLDFGLVKALGEPALGDSALTREDMIHGTPAFMAPEQAMGEASLDGRADIYATGCVAYWLLTGQPVFTAETAVGLLVQHANTPAAPPSSRTEMPIPASLDRLVLSCLAKDPAQRPQSARELARRLDEVEGAHAWTEERARQWWARYLPAAQ